MFDQGEIKEVGNHNELMTRNGIYTQLVRAQEIEQYKEEEEEKHGKSLHLLCLSTNGRDWILTRGGALSLFLLLYANKKF